MKLGTPKLYTLVLIWQPFAMPARAQALPVFAHEFGVSCQACHSIVPELNDFGRQFRDAGYRWPAKQSFRPALPVAFKTNIAYSSVADDGLPKTIVDEVEFLSFGPIREHFAYRFEQYWLDGGRIGNTRDAYLQYQSDPMKFWHGQISPVFTIQLGKFTLPLPNDPETLRPTENHYALYDQTVGTNPSAFFNDGTGLNIAYGNRAASLNVVLLDGRDTQSSLESTGTDTMFVARVGMNPLSLWGYSYRGKRPLGPVEDRFVRRGFGLTSLVGKAQTSLVCQTGDDSSPTGLGDPGTSSGGYAQEEWTFSDRWIAVVRYDGVKALGAPLRSTTFALNYRPYDRARLTLEYVDQTQPRRANTLNAAWLFAY